MLILLGKSCSGKSTIQRELINLGMEPILEYTTRPKRVGEVNGEQYHFVTDRDFKRLKRIGYFAVNVSYKVLNGERWSYGIAKEDLSDNKVIITNPLSLGTLKNLTGIHPIVFYIDVNENVAWDRLLKRKGNIYEAQRRIISDRNDFKDIEQHVDFVFANNGVTPPVLLADIIKDTYKKHIKNLKKNNGGIV